MNDVQEVATYLGQSREKGIGGKREEEKNSKEEVEGNCTVCESWYTE